MGLQENDRKRAEENQTEYGEKKKKLIKLMEKLTKEDICLAFSGGVDSSLLLKLACECGKKTGRQIYAVTFATRLHPSCDMENARQVAEELGSEHVILQIDELEQKEIRNNPPDRCYLCKRYLFSQLRKFGEKRGITCYLDGTNRDDLKEYRPGLKALGELSVTSPLALCGFTKEEVRRMAGEYGISAAKRPSAPCMATRLPYGTEIDYELLDRIGAGEELLKKYVEGNVRLRLHGDIARIEIDEGQFGQFMADREEIVKGLKHLGFVYITLDVEGFRSGSMDVYMKNIH